MAKLIDVSAETHRGLNIWDKMTGWLAEWRARRETLRLLAERRPGELRDIGMTGDDIDRARFACDVGQLARETRAERSGNW